MKNSNLTKETPTWVNLSFTNYSILDEEELKKVLEANEEDFTPDIDEDEDTIVGRSPTKQTYKTNESNYQKFQRSPSDHLSG